MPQFYFKSLVQKDLPFGIPDYAVKKTKQNKEKKNLFLHSISKFLIMKSQPIREGRSLGMVE